MLTLPVITLRSAAVVPPIELLRAASRDMPGPLSRATLPVTSVPIRLPTTTLPRASPPIMRLAPLPEMRFRAASVVPPIVQKLDPVPRTPTPLPTAIVPVTSVPMKLHDRRNDRRSEEHTSEL